MHRLLVALSLALTPALLHADDWREFRGPGGKGHYTGAPLPTAWGTGTNVTWKTPLPGHGWSSPIVVKGKLFLTTAIPNAPEEPTKYSLRALCLDAASGKVLWDKELFVEDVKATPQPHKKNSHASSTPVSDGEKVYFHFGHMGTACHDLAGAEVWKTRELTYHPVHGNGSSPLLVDDLLVVTCDGREDPYLAALDTKTGKVRWKTERKNGTTYQFSYATPARIEHAGKRVIVSPASHYTMGYDPKTGAELWRVKYPVPGWSLIALPVYAHGLVFVCTGYANQHLIVFRPDGTGDITDKIVWTAKRNAANTPTPLVIGDEFYMIADGGFMTCYDAKTGKVHWSERLAGKVYSASPIVAGGKIYVTSEEGLGQLLEVGKEFKELARFDMQEKTFATFVPADGALYVRTETQLYRFDAKK